MKNNKEPDFFSNHLEYEKIKSLQLGMSISKAYHTLKKNIRFWLARNIEMNYCYICKNLIDDIKEFSIEHKINWLDSHKPISLFYDLNNIAFSHISCNIKSAYYSNDNYPKYNSKSGFKGVYHKKKANKWQAVIFHDGKKKYLGSYTTALEAAIVYDETSKKIFGNLAITNEFLGLIPNKISKCSECHKPLNKVGKTNLCQKCYKKSTRKVERPNREELEKLIFTIPFLQIGKIYGVSDNAVRKWCKSYDLPSKSTEIKKLLKEKEFVTT